MYQNLAYLSRQNKCMAKTRNCFNTLAKVVVLQIKIRNQKRKFKVLDIYL